MFLWNSDTLIYISKKINQTGGVKPIQIFLVYKQPLNFHIELGDINL